MSLLKGGVQFLQAVDEIGCRRDADRLSGLEIAGRGEQEQNEELSHEDVRYIF